MTQYLALVRLYYLVDGKKVCAPANSVAFDFPEDQVEAALAKGYIRKATVGEVAESESKRPAKEAAKRGPKPKAKPAAEEPKKADGDDAKKADGEDLA